MTSKNIQVAYDAEADVLSFESGSSAAIDHAQEMGNFVVHFNKKDEPVLIEVLEASKTFRGQASPLEEVVALAET